MDFILTRLKRYYPILILLIVELLLFLANYQSGTYFLGWDNLFPEVNFPANLQRSIFAIWQEYRGLGLLDGMSYAANLPHYLFLLILSFAVPQNLLRYAFVFLMHLSGGIGIYFLISGLLSKHTFNKIASLFGSLFYLLNIATVQMFYAPLELFTVHFAFLPFLLFFASKYLTNGLKKDLLWFLVFSLVSSSQAHVPTIFLVYIFALTVILIFKLLDRGKQKLSRILTIVFLTFLINSFWGIPYFYSATHNAQTISDSKINQMSTEDIYLKNKQFGSLREVVLLRGFGLNFVDNQPDGTIQYMMGNWRKYLDYPELNIIGYFFFLITLVGLFTSIRNKNKAVYPYITLFIFSFLMLGDDIPVLNIFSQALNTFVPYFYQLFRFTFTKFSILFVLNYAILFSIGILVIIDTLKKIKFLKYSFLGLLGISLIYHSLPSFTGYFLYPNLRNKIPQEYFQLVDFFKKQNRNQRIATLPQPSYWGWTYTNWGYKGSGFLWYGLPQATLDGAFYPWSRENENYYWEISQAIYSLDTTLLDRVFDKYQIHWLIVDKNTLNPFSQRGLYLEKTENLLRESNKFILTTVIDNLEIYKVNLETTSKDFVFLADNLPRVGPEYKWNNLDKGYEEYGNYVSVQAQRPALKAQNQSLKLKSGESNDKLSGGFGGSVVTSGPALTDHEKNDQAKKSHDEHNRPESWIREDISVYNHNLNLLVRNILEPQQNNVSTKLDSITPISLLSMISAPNRKANDTDPAFMPISESTLYSDFEKRITSSEYHENKNIVNQVFAAEDSDSSTVRGVHAATAEVSSGLLVPDIYYPFRSLFTGRQQNELEFGVEDTADYFSFKAKIPKELIGYKLVIPTMEEKEVTQLDASDLSKKLVKTPQIYLDGEFVPFASSSASILDLSYIKEGKLEVRVPKIKGYYSSELNPILLNLEQKTCDHFNKGIYTHERIRVRPLTPLRPDPESEDLLRLTSIGSSNCLDFDLPNLSQDIGYLVTVQNRNIEGKSLLFSVMNKNSQRADIETYLPKRSEPTTHNPQPTTSYFIIPPMEQYGLGYTLHLDNISIGRVKTENDLGRITVNPIPYRFLTSLKVIKGDTLRTQGVTLQSIRVDHPNPSLYQIIVNKEQITDNTTTLVLSQSFDSGWKAYRIQNSESRIKNLINIIFPFWTGQEIKDHVLVNNWENGWQLNNETMQQCNNEQCNIIIVYLPQYLQYLGFILLGVGILVVIFYPKSTHNLQPTTHN